MKKAFYAIILPVSVQITAIFALNWEGENPIETLREFAMGMVIFTLMWGLIVLIPMTIAQIMCARSLIAADCRNRDRFLVAILNPGLALTLLIVLGLLV